jgi:electron transport complex protein RnfG
MKKILISVVALLIVVALFITFQDEYKTYVDDYNITSRLRDYEQGEILRVYSEKDGSNIFIVEKEGYNPGLLLLVQIKDSKVEVLKILQHNETHDYGGYADNEWFLSRFIGPIVDKFELVKIRSEADNEIVAVTGATFTSQAIVDAVNKCLEINGGLK